MNTILRAGALTLTLLAGAALLPQAASAGSVHGRGDSGGTWTYVGPSDPENRRYAGQYYDYSGPVYVAPSYAYGPDYYVPDLSGAPVHDPGTALVGPGVGLSPEID